VGNELIGCFRTAADSPELCKNRNAFARDSCDGFGEVRGAVHLHDVGATFVDKLRSRTDGAVDAPLKWAVWKVATDQRSCRSPADGPADEDHLVHGHVPLILTAPKVNPNRISNGDDVDAGAIGDARNLEVPADNSNDLAPAALHLVQHGDGDPVHDLLFPDVFLHDVEGNDSMEKVLAAVRVGPGTTEIREFPMPDISSDSALMKMEVAGICGTDVKMYETPPSNAPVIMGHENIGVVAKAGLEFTRHKGFREGDLVFVEHYVMCGKCVWCHTGQYRHCENTDWRRNPDAIRYGYTSAERAPHLWGGFAQYVYLPWNAVVHRVPKGITPELAGLVTPMANGVEWSLFDGGVGYNSAVLIEGPGQQGLSQVVVCKQAGASLIIVTGTSKDRARLDVARALGADHVIDVETEDPLSRIMQITNGRGMDVVLDCTAGAGTMPVLLGVDALKRKGGTMVIQGEMAEFANFPIGKITLKFITIKSARGHSYMACELALEQLASKRFPLEKVATHTFGLNDVDLAIRSVGGHGLPGVIHASLMPWK
jgi:threonine dehydrogenase-like Zn-dependent dehydrogenase